MALEGDLSLFRLPDILQVISHQKKTGILTVQGKNDILAVSFLEGSIVAADALNQSFDELLGDVLAQRGVLEPPQFRRLLDEQRNSGERLVEFLAESSGLRREQLYEAIEALTFRLILDVLRWREGQFKFYGGEEVAFEEGIRPLRVDDLMLRAQRELPPEEGRAVPAVHGYLPYVAIIESRPIRSIPAGFDEATPLDPKVIWLTPEEQDLLARLDGRTPAEGLARLSGQGEAKTYLALTRLMELGLARVLGEGEEPPSVGLAPASARPTPPAEVLSVEARVVEAADEILLGPEPLGRRGRAAVRLLPLAAAVVALVAALQLPGALLFPSPATRQGQGAFDRLRRSGRFAVIDRAARTFHLLEGRYPATLHEMIQWGLVPERVGRDLRGRALDYRPRGEEYELVPASSDSDGLGVREGVFGDFLLDRSLFAGLAAEGGVPIVLID